MNQNLILNDHNEWVSPCSVYKELHHGESSTAAGCIDRDIFSLFARCFSPTARGDEIPHQNKIPTCLGRVLSWFKLSRAAQK